MNTVSPLPRHRLDRSRHAAPQVFERLRAQIISMDLAPGVALSRAQLAEAFGLSQTPIRDALMRLAEEGLVDVFPQHATVVRPIDLSLARQAHFLRLAVELEIVATLAAAPDRVLTATLDGAISKQAALAASGDYSAFVSADQAFHLTLYQAAKVPDLYELVRRQSGHLDRLRHLHLPLAGKVDKVLDDHRAIVAAIAASDGNAAQAALRAHLSGTLHQLDEIRAHYPHYLVD